jgi:hypothetical protein
MTDKQKLRNRERAAKLRAALAVAIEQFKKTTVGVSTRHSDGNYDVTEYPDFKIEGLALRVMVYKRHRKGKKAEPELRWFFERPGRRALEINCRWEETPREARERVRLLLAGDEDTIMCTYLNNDHSVDSNECSCFCPSDLLQEKTIEELELEVEEISHYLNRWAKEGASAVRHACHLVPVRCRIRHLKAMLKRYAKFCQREGLQIKIKAEPTREAA